MGLSPAQGRVRRRIWYLLAGGFVAMVALTFLLFYLSFATAGMVVDCFTGLPGLGFHGSLPTKRQRDGSVPAAFRPRYISNFLVVRWTSAFPPPGTIR
jgi:hypothetical protein